MSKKNEGEGPGRVGDLEIAEDMRFERRDWKVQHVAWVVMLLLIIAALMGLLGPSPLTRWTAGEIGGPIVVQYYRFERLERPTELKVTLARPSGAAGEAKIWLNRAYAEGIEIEQITPEPTIMQAQDDRLVFSFALGEGARPAAIVFHFQHNNIGGVKGRMGLVGGAEVEFRQLVYP